LRCGTAAVSLSSLEEAPWLFAPLFPSSNFILGCPRLPCLIVLNRETAVSELQIF